MPIARVAGRGGLFVAVALVTALGGSVIFAATAGSFAVRVAPRSVLTSPEFGMNEPTAAIHPLTPRRLLAAAIQSSNPESRVAIASSIDGGKSWRQHVLPLGTGDQAHFDPYAAWTPDGTAWMGLIANTAAGGRFRVFRSSDSGLTWTLDGTPSGTLLADRSALWADSSATSKYRGTLYANWHTEGVPYLSWRRGGTWSPPRRLSGPETKGYAQGGDVRVDPAGAVYVFWPDAGAPGPASHFIYATRSTNGGATFGKPVKVAALNPKFSFVLTPSNTNTRLVAPAVDRRGRTQLAYVIWMDLAGDLSCADSAADGILFLSAASPCETRIWFSRSTDGGRRWSAPRALFDPPGSNDQFNPALAVDSTTGFLYAMYHDTTGDPQRVRTNLWMQMSKDRGVTWSAPFKVTEPSSAGIWYGHYEGLAAGRGVVFPVWTSGDKALGKLAETWMGVLAPQP